MDWVLQHRAKWLRGREVVTESTYRVGAGRSTWWRVLRTKREDTFKRAERVQQTDNFIFKYQVEVNRNHTYRPSTEQINQEIATKACGEHLGDNIQVGYQGRLQDDGDVGGVKKLDGVSVVLATVASWLDGQIDSESLRGRGKSLSNCFKLSFVVSSTCQSFLKLSTFSLSPTTYLEVYHYSKDEYCGDEVHEVGQVLSVEGLSQSTHFVRASGQQVEKSNDRSFKFCAWEHKPELWGTALQTAEEHSSSEAHILWPSCPFLTSSSVHSCGAEGLPHNGLTDVGSNKQWDPWTKTIPLLEQLVQQQHNHASHKQL